MRGARQWATRNGGRVVRYGLALLALVFIVDALVGDKGLIALVAARRDFALVESALQQARDDNQRLRDEARRLREDPAAIEELARRELGLIKPGETLVIVKDPVPPR